MSTGLEISFLQSGYSLPYGSRPAAEAEMSVSDWAEHYRIPIYSHVIRTYEHEGIPLVVVHKMLVGAGRRFESALDIPYPVAMNVLVNNPEDTRLRPARENDPDFVRSRYSMVQPDHYITMSYWAALTTEEVEISGPTRWLGPELAGKPQAEVVGKGLMVIATY